MKVTNKVNFVVCLSAPLCRLNDDTVVTLKPRQVNCVADMVSTDSQLIISYKCQVLRMLILLRVLQDLRHRTFAFAVHHTSHENMICNIPTIFVMSVRPSVQLSQADNFYFIDSNENSYYVNQHTILELNYEG